jgi:hypothetical protein
MFWNTCICVGLGRSLAGLDFWEGDKWVVEGVWGAYFESFSLVCIFYQVGIYILSPWSLIFSVIVVVLWTCVNKTNLGWCI